MICRKCGKDGIVVDDIESYDESFIVISLHCTCCHTQYEQEAMLGELEEVN